MLLIKEDIQSKFLQLSLLIFLSVMVISCKNPELGNAKGSTEVINDSEGYFKGIIELEEKDVLGVRSNITLTFNGNDVKREVTEKLFKNISYGMIYRKTKDSVDYYYVKDKKSWHTSISKSDFKKWVYDLEKPSSEVNEISTTIAGQAPFGLIFEYFNSSGNAVSTTIIDAPLKNISSMKCQTFLVPNDKSCHVWYSDDIKIRPEILEIIEHNQPKSIKTLALQVQYFSPKSTGEKDTFDKVFDKVNKVVVKTEKKIELNSINADAKVSIDLPENSEKVSLEKLNDIVFPPQEYDGNSNSGRRHHHDFF